MILLQAKGCKRLQANHQQLGERPGTESLSQPLEVSVADTFILYFWPPELKFLLFKTGVPNLPVRNWATRQEVSGGSASQAKASSVFTVAPHLSHHHLRSASYQISGGVRLS